MSGFTPIRTAWLAAALALGYVSSAGAADIPAKPVDGKIQWVYSYAEGKELAKKTGKPLFVVFRCER